MDNDDFSSALNAEKEWIANSLRPIDSLQSPVWVYDVENTRVLWCNRASLGVWQADSKRELLSRDMGANMSLSVAKRLEQYKVDFTNDAHIQFREIWTLHPNGEPTTFNMVFSAYQLNTGRICLFCEVSNVNSNEIDSLRSSEALLHTPVNISLYAATGEPLYRNPAARSSVLAAKNTLEQHFDNPNLIHQLQNTETDEVNTVTVVNTVHGQRWHDITARRCLDAVSGDAAWLISEVDVSRLKTTEERAQFLAEHDTLTQLPNRNYVSIYFQSRIDKLLSATATGALVYLDLDNFKDVNDTLGHDAGDQLLIEVASRLRGVSSVDNSIARLGGDEFILLFGSSEADFNIETIANGIIDVVSEPITLQGRKIQVTPSIGVALFPDNGVNIQDLMRHADLAMYHAKDVGKNNFAYFVDSMSEAVESRISLEADIKAAIRNDEFMAYFQPRVDVNTGVIVGAEALARWQHPTRGMVPPDSFIPACEESGQISGLGKIIFTQAAIAQKKWTEQGFDLRVSVNLSPLQFADSSLVDDLMRVVQQQKVNPNSIELEITESVLLGNDQETIDKLHRLVELGFQISIDDFGTGYSNLAYLHRYPIDCLKIDRSFIQSLDTAQPIVELIVSMAKLFDLCVVAEGVEEESQLEVLRQYQCNEYQGYLFEKPIEFEQFSRLLEYHSTRAA